MARKKDGSGITPAKAKQVIAVAKVLGPVVLPVVTPYVVKAASTVREQWDRRRARRLGVDVGDLGHFTGKGGALHARIAGAAAGVADLRGKSNVTADELAFADSAERTLEQLAAAVRAAERMPTARRKGAHRAAATELDRIEQTLLSALGL